jgi:hypothetical protein
MNISCEYCLEKNADTAMKNLYPDQKIPRLGKAQRAQKCKQLVSGTLRFARPAYGFVLMDRSDIRGVSQVISQ